MEQLSRRSFVRILAAASGATALSFMAGCASSAASSSSVAASSESFDSNMIASFAVISDIHINPDNETSLQRFRDALKDIASYEPKVSGLLLIGDQVDSGIQAEYDLFKSIVAGSPFSLDDMTIACGNHEYYSHEGSEIEVFHALNERFATNYGVPGIYYDTYVAGLHFIVLGNDKDHDDWPVGVFQFSDTQINWLNSLLKKDYENGITSFVMCHQPIPGTVNGCFEGQWGWNNSMGDYDANRLLDTISAYPGTVLLTGHTHMFPAVADDTSGTNSIFVNDGSCARSYRSLAGTGPRELVSDGVRMDVYNDHLDIWLRNFTTLEWENSPISVKLSRPPRPTE